MENPYDRIPYLGRSHQQTHIEKIAGIPFLFGIPFPDIKHARVLELGCGDGSNLLNMAHTLPCATFVGMDGSLVQIERGKESLALAGIKNLTLLHADLLNLDESLGIFDYIICHGVYSWVPPQVRHAILNICRKHLQPEGIAYISYNALPGWRMYSMVRDMMRYHVRNIPQDQKKTEQSVAMLQFVGQHVVDPVDSYGSFIRESMDYLSHSTSEYIFHEYLEEHNQAFYFHEFVETLNEHGLQYLGNTDFNTMNNLHFPEETQEVLNEISGNIHNLEQYMDFLRFRRFRCDLITHASRDYEREVTLDPFKKGYFTLSIFHSQEESPTPKDVLDDIFENTFIENHQKSLGEIPLFALTMQSIYNSWPRYIHFSEICNQVQTARSQDVTHEEQVEIAALLQTLLLRNSVDVHLFQPQIATRVSDHPCASAIARAQIRYQYSISTQHHTMIALKDKWMREILPYLDGTHTREALCSLMQTRAHDDPTLFPEEDTTYAEKLNQFLDILLQKGVLIS